jgi:hypothetical protein
MRIQGRYRVTLNGFRCNNSTWDDALNRDGFADEVFFHFELRHVDGTGNMPDEIERRTTRTLGSEGDGRYVFGSGRNIFGEHRGIASGDMFPGDPPWLRSHPYDPNPSDVPSLLIWEGDLVTDWEGDHTDYWVGRQVTHENMVFITPTIWERDPGEDAMNGWVDWLVRSEERFGQQARETVKGLWPQALPVLEAVSLGIRLLGTVEEVTGRAGTKPIGTQRNPETGELSFTPEVIDLTQARAEQMLARKSNHGYGVRQFTNKDSDYLRGDYDFWVQVERIGILRELPPRGQVAPQSGGTSVDEIGTIDLNGIPPQGKPLAYRPHG